MKGPVDRFDNDFLTLSNVPDTVRPPEVSDSFYRKGARRLVGVRTRTRVGGVLAAATVGVALLAPSSAGAATATIEINGDQHFQSIDGFGFAEAFQRAEILHGSQGLSPANQQAALDLLFNPRTGAGFSILRNGIGSSPTSDQDFMNSIEPVSPGSPDATPHYVWDGSDSGQLWVSQQAELLGVHRIYADAWSAPGFMKTNGSDDNGGFLCGVTGQTCATGDWRQAYANYLVQYLRFYQESGVHVTDLGFLNEPDLTVSYASMNSDGQQAADVLRVLGPTLARSGLHTTIACCDAAGWNEEASRLAGIQADPRAYRYLGLATGHGYVDPPAAPLATNRHVWESEWADFNPFDPTWDDGTPASGMVWAQRIQSALTTANVNAFSYWWGASASTANSGLIRLQGDSVTTTKRLWAFGAFAKFIRPGAVRIGATSADTGVTVSSFRNRDGSVVVEMINNGTSDVTETVGLRGVHGHLATPFVTNNDDSVTAQHPVPVFGNEFSATVPARSLVTYVLPGRE
jgi:O-glycosyl hydrolase